MHANHLTKDDGRSCKWLQISTLHLTNQKSKDFKYSLTMNTNPYKHPVQMGQKQLNVH